MLTMRSIDRIRERALRKYLNDERTNRLMTKNEIRDFVDKQWRKLVVENYGEKQ